MVKHTEIYIKHYYNENLKGNEYDKIIFIND